MVSYRLLGPGHRACQSSRSSGCLQLLTVLHTAATLLCPADWDAGVQGTTVMFLQPISCTHCLKSA